jgi:hypothetical protein
VLPQPSPAVPQLNPWAVHVDGVQPAITASVSPMPHLSKPPPPQTAGEAHVPH